MNRRGANSAEKTKEFLTTDELVARGRNAKNFLTKDTDYADKVRNFYRRDSTSAEKRRLLVYKSLSVLKLNISKKDQEKNEAV